MSHQLERVATKTGGSQCSRRRSLFARAAGAGALALLDRSAFAQAYPDKTIKIVVPGSPGGPTDVMARLVAQRMQTALGQSVIIDNRGGGGGSVAAKVVAASDPDGLYTAVLQYVRNDDDPRGRAPPEYDPVKDFAPVAKVSQSEQLLVVHPSIPVNTLPEFIAYLKANPGKLNCGATGSGGLPHMVAEYFRAKAGVDFATIQYKGGGESLNAVLGHQVDFTIETTTILLPHIREGKLKGLGIE